MEDCQDTSEVNFTGPPKDLDAGDAGQGAPVAANPATLKGFAGTYNLIKSENFDEYMKAIGVGFMLRKMASAAKPITEVKTSGDDWTITTKTHFKTTEIKFKLGQEFDETTGDGRKCKSIITLTGAGGNTLLHTQKCGGPPLRIWREFTGNEMKMVMEAPGGIKATRVYKKE